MFLIVRRERTIVSFEEAWPNRPNILWALRYLKGTPYNLKSVAPIDAIPTISGGNDIEPYQFRVWGFSPQIDGGST